MALILIYNLVLGLVNYGLGLGLDTYGLGLGGSGLHSITATNYHNNQCTYYQLP